MQNLFLQNALNFTKKKVIQQIIKLWKMSAGNYQGLVENRKQKINSDDIALPSLKTVNCPESKATSNSWLSYLTKKNRVHVLFKHNMLHSQGG